jgi:mannose/fructose/N-acetylgalactosamine-specific phosphotransferase system component IIC
MHVLAVPLQWSVPSHAPPVEVPLQVVALGAKTSAGHVPEDPVHVSATSHWPAEPRQVKLLGWKTSMHVLAVPLQWSVPSQAPPVEVPVQVVALGANTSAGQTPDDPVQVSATSHWPAEPRQVKLLGWKTSIQVLAVPLQWSAPSHAPPVEVPVQVVALGAKTSAGHVPEDPVHVSATSH